MCWNRQNMKHSRSFCSISIAPRIYEKIKCTLFLTVPCICVSFQKRVLHIIQQWQPDISRRIYYHPHRLRLRKDLAATPESRSADFLDSYLRNSRARGGLEVWNSKIVSNWNRELIPLSTKGEKEMGNTERKPYEISSWFHSRGYSCFLPSWRLSSLERMELETEKRRNFDNYNIFLFPSLSSIWIGVKMNHTKILVISSICQNFDIAKFWYD